MMTSRFISILLALVVPVIATGLVFWTLRQQEQQLVSTQGVDNQLGEEGNLRPVGEIAEFLEEMKLITVRIRSKVVSEERHKNWRGAAGARVTAPADFFYGVDLKHLGNGAVQPSLKNPRHLKITVPAPRLQAVEVFARDEEIAVQTSGLRFRTRAGEYYLGLARRKLHERARRRALLPEQMERVMATTRRQIRKLAETFAGDDYEITVVFRNG